MQESNLRTDARNPSSGALGIGQWLGGRKTNLLNRGKSGGLQGQLDFLWSELQGPERGALDRLRKANTVEDAASAFTWGFERPGQAEANMANRVRQGRAALGLAGSTAGSDVGDGAAPRYKTTSTTTPGIDNRQARAQLILSFLNQKDFDPLDFATKAVGLRDVAPTTTSRQVRLPGSTRATPSTGGGGGEVHGSGIRELFWQGANGINLKNGQPVPQGFVSGHTDHVHVAAGPQTVVALGKVAQDRFGLHVGENPHFGGVNPVHAQNSYHYKNEAIDVSGDARKMAAFAKYVADYQKAHG